MFSTSKCVLLWPDDVCATLYFISSEEDYDYLVKHLRVPVFLKDDFPKFGKGYYFFVQLDGGDGPDTFSLHNAAYYLESIQVEFDAWKEEVGQAMFDIAVSRGELKNG